MRPASKLAGRRDMTSGRLMVEEKGGWGIEEYFTDLQSNQ